MKIRNAVSILTEALKGFNEAVAHSDRLQMAEVVMKLHDTIPNLLIEDIDKDAFIAFVAHVKKELITATEYVLSSSLMTNDLRCLEHSSFVNCGGPPNSQSRCDLCGKRGRV